MILLVLSAVDLGLGLVNYANILATYGFYSLVLGVVLQIGSYVIIGNKPYPDDQSSTLPASDRFELSRKYKIMAVVAVISIMAGIISIQYLSIEIPIVGLTTTNQLVITTTVGPSVITTTIGQSVITTTVGQSVITSTVDLSHIYASEFFARVFSEPQNETLVAFGVNANGASSPYSFRAEWSDGFVQTNSIGTFSRTFQQGQAIPTSVTVVISSSDKQSTTVFIQLPASSATSSTSIQKSQNSSDVSFIESGLPSKLNWSVTLNKITESSTSNAVNFSELTNGAYDFNVTYHFNGNFSYAFKYAPVSGSVDINGTNQIVTITFSKISQSQVLTLAKQPSVSVINNVPSITLNYTNNLPVHLQCLLFALLNDSTGHVITSATAALSFGPESTSIGQITFISLAPGNYSATVFVESSGAVISQKAILKVTIP